MDRLVRKQVYIEEEQNRRLKSLAKVLSVSESEIIRTALDVALAEKTVPRPNKQAWEREKAFMRKRMEHPVEPPSEPWTREDLYEERLSRWR